MRTMYPSTLLLASFALALAVNPRAVRAAEPHPACKSAPQTQQLLASRTLASGLTEYYGRYELYTPEDNALACDQRQILFNVGRLLNDDKPGTGNAPVVTIIIEHGLFHCRAKDMTVYTIGTQVYPAMILYTVDAESAGPKKGAYYADISVVGQKR